MVGARGKSIIRQFQFKGCNGAVERGGSLGALFLSADWQGRVFWSSVLVDRPSERLYIHTITLPGFMYRRSCYNPFYSHA